MSVISEEGTLFLSVKGSKSQAKFAKESEAETDEDEPVEESEKEEEEEGDVAGITPASKKMLKRTINFALDDNNDDEPFKMRDRKKDAAAAAEKKRPVVVINETNKKFRQDPEAQLLDSMPPYYDRDEVRDWNSDGKIQDMVRHQDLMDRHVDREWDNPEIRFLKMVKGGIRDHTNLRVEAVGQLDESLAPLSRVVHTENLGGGGFPSAVQRLAPTFPTDEDIERIDLSKPATTTTTTANGGASKESELQKTLVRNAQERAKREFEYAHNVAHLLNSSHLQGRVQMTDEIYHAVNKALCSLALKNMAKFGKAKREHFYTEDLVMTLFADLVILEYTIANTMNPRQLYHDRDTNRRKIERDQLVVQINNTCEWNAKTGGYSINDPEDIREEQLTQLRAVANAGKQVRFSLNRFNSQSVGNSGRGPTLAYNTYNRPGYFNKRY